MGARHRDRNGIYVLADGAIDKPVKTKAVAVTPGFVWGKLGGLAYKIRATV